MSQSTDKVKIQIPGTMYYFELADKRGRWVLSLLLRNDVEKELAIPVLSKNGLRKAAKELIVGTRLVIDDHPLGKVCDQLYEDVAGTMAVVQPSTEGTTVATVPSSQFDEIKKKIDLIETTLENVVEELKENINNINESLTSLETARVARLETELTKDAGDRGQDEMISTIQERLSNIEEALASSQGDERIPSILTAVEALESKIAQLEGTTTITKEEGRDLDDITFLKEEFAKLSGTFDMINERLTKAENKLRALSAMSSDDHPIEQ